MSPRGHPCDDDDHYNYGAHDWNYHDADRRLTGHIIDGDGDDLDMTGDIVSDDNKDVVGVAVLEVPEDWELAGIFHERRFITFFVPRDVVSLVHPHPAVEPGGRARAVDVEVEQLPVLQQLVPCHGHVANGLLGDYIFTEDRHFDLVIGWPVVLPQCETFLVSVVQQAD